MWVIPENLSPSFHSAQEEARSRRACVSPESRLKWWFTWRSKRSPASTWRLRLRKGDWLQRLSGRIFNGSPTTFYRCYADFLASASSAASPASPGAQPESEKVRKTSGGSGPPSTGSFAWYDQAGASWRTSQGSFMAGSDLYLQPWPTSGSMRNGRAFVRQTSARRIAESGSSFSGWPTPQTADGERASGNLMRGEGNPTLQGAARQWATPAARDYKDGELPHRNGGRALTTDAEQWQTPTATSAEKHSSGNRREASLFHQAREATGTAFPSTSGPPSRERRRLNWRFVAWLMGWTDAGLICFDSSETESYRNKPPSPSESLREGLERSDGDDSKRRTREET